MELTKLNSFLGRVVNSIIEGKDRVGNLTESEVAKTILQQMGGANRIKAMTGAKEFVAHNDALSFHFPNKSGPNNVKITLTDDDLYDMEFNRYRSGNLKLVKRYEGIYADQLIKIFEKETGLYLRL